jgi:hypothetical protein
MTVGVCRVDLHAEDHVRGGELGAFAGGGVLNQVLHADDARAARLVESIPEFWECSVERRHTLAVWEERAHRARRDIAALAAAGLGVSELHAAAIRVIGDEVSAELTCWAAIDPETLVISTMVSGETRIPPEYEPRLTEAEYPACEPHRFATLALRKEPVAKLSDLPDRERDRSARLNNV